jgi:predicted RND superfamily exporter protein
VFQERFVGWSTDRAGEGAVRITLLVHDTGEGFGPLVQAVKESLPGGDIEAFCTGTVATVVTLSKNLVGGIAAGLTASLIVMAVLCGMLLGSVRLALVAALPNLFPLVFVFGVMGLTCWVGSERLAIPINSGSAMVATIALGIALNDTIHFLLYYRRQTREGGLNVHEGIRRTFQHVGRPIILTSLVHVAGFSIFLLSDFQPLYHFGLLSMIAMLAALVGDLVLLPNLLVAFDRVPAAPSSQSV